MGIKTSQVIQKLKVQKYRIFLSHSGRDAKLATELAKALERSLKKRGYPTEVFNTSEPEHRFHDPKEVITGFERWSDQYYQYEQDLRHYLEKNLKLCSGYVLLVTWNSLQANSKWVKFELDFARSRAESDLDYLFVPCVARGASLHDLPKAAIMFNGVDLENKGTDYLGSVFAHWFSKHDNLKKNRPDWLNYLFSQVIFTNKSADRSKAMSTPKGCFPCPLTGAFGGDDAPLRFAAGTMPQAVGQLVDCGKA